MNRTGSYQLSNMQNSRVRSFSIQDKDKGLGGIYENCKEACNHNYFILIIY